MDVKVNNTATESLMSAPARTCFHIREERTTATLKEDNLNDIKPLYSSYRRFWWSAKNGTFERWPGAEIESYSKYGLAATSHDV